jgi:hypothetical protein
MCRGKQPVDIKRGDVLQGHALFFPISCLYVTGQHLGVLRPAAYLRPDLKLYNVQESFVASFICFNQAVDEPKRLTAALKATAAAYSENDASQRATTHPFGL